MNDYERNVWLFVCSCLFYQQIYLQHKLSLHYLQYSCEHTSTLERVVGCFPCFIFYALQNGKSVFIAFLACESKSNLIIFITSLIKKRLFCGIFCNLLIMVLITIVSLSLSLNKLGNIFNCDTNLLMPMYYNILATNNNFCCRQKLKT